jgi:hypothetical protein
VPGDFLSPKIIQAAGLLGFAVFGGFWMVTDRLEPLLLAFAGSLITGGNLLEVYLKLRSPASEPTPPPIAPAPEEPPA